MTPAELIAWAHEETGTVGQPVTPAEEKLAELVEILKKGCSSAYLQLEFRINFAKNAALKPLKLETEPPVT